jgi:hypothetical protein
MSKPLPKESAEMLGDLPEEQVDYADQLKSDSREASFEAAA